MSDVLNYSLDNLLQVLSGSISPDLINHDSLMKIRKQASLLPPVYRGGIELRLKKDYPVDLHQCIHPNKNELELFINYISSTKTFDHNSWFRIRKFCDSWLNPSSILSRHIADIWLEFDVIEHSETPIPSVFITLDHYGPGKSLKTSAQKAVETAIELLLGKPPSKRLMDKLIQCYTSSPAGTGITHVGIMLSRIDHIIRLNVGALNPDQVINYLRKIHWPGEIEKIESIFISTCKLTGPIALCLDVGKKILPKLGMECLFKGSSDNIPKWECLLDHLVENKLCSKKKRNALLSWPGFTYPGSSSVPWPDHLLIESLLRSSSDFSVFSRKLNHVKLTWSPNQPIEAKAYLWFNHIWFNSNK